MTLSALSIALQALGLALTPVSIAIMGLLPEDDLAPTPTIATSPAAGSSSSRSHRRRSVLRPMPIYPVKRPRRAREHSDLLLLLG